MTIVDSSSDDDCIILSDDEEPEEEPEEDTQNSGLHVNDAYNTPDEQGRVVINIGHPEGDSDIFLAPQIARVIKPHQVNIWIKTDARNKYIIQLIAGLKKIINLQKLHSIW